MKRKYNEFYIGLIVTVTIFVVIGMIVLLESNNFLQGGFTINLIVQDAKGIKTGGNVMYKGLEVGSIEETKLNDKGVLLKLNITKIDSIPKDSKFTISATSIIGNQSIEITPGKSKIYFANGAFVKGQSSSGFSDIIQNGSKITENINKVVKNIDTITNNKTKEEIRSALNKINQSVNLIHSSLQNNLDDIRATIKNLKQITSNNKTPIDSMINRLSEHSKNLSDAMDNTQKITDDIGTLIAEVKNGKGTIGKFLKDDEVYDNLNTAIKHLDDLINDIKANPGKYVSISIF